MAKYPALFFNRDGTLIDDVGHINQLSYKKFNSITFDAGSILQYHLLLFNISHQSGITKGVSAVKELSDLNQHIVSILKEQDIVVCDCPHKNEDNSDCKTLKTHFIDKAHQLYNIDLSWSFSVNDHPFDAECGLFAGITPIYLLTGNGQIHQNYKSKETVFRTNLFDASKYIIFKNNQI